MVKVLDLCLVTRLGFLRLIHSCMVRLCTNIVLGFLQKCQKDGIMAE